MSFLKKIIASAVAGKQSEDNAHCLAHWQRAGVSGIDYRPEESLIMLYSGKNVALATMIENAVLRQFANSSIPYNYDLLVSSVILDEATSTIGSPSVYIDLDQQKGRFVDILACVSAAIPDIKKAYSSCRDRDSAAMSMQA